MASPTLAAAVILLLPQFGHTAVHYHDNSFLIKVYVVLKFGKSIICEGIKVLVFCGFELSYSRNCK